MNGRRPVGANEKKMSVLLLSMWYYPEPVAKPHELAGELHRRGYDVTVVTGFPNYPKGAIYPGYKRKLWTWDEVDGVRVLRVLHFPDRSQSALRRVISYMSFSLFATFLSLLLVGRPRVIWSYQIGLPGLLLATIWRVPHVHEVQDLWPDWGQSAGIGVKAWLFRLLEWQQRTIYRHARHITTISDGFKRMLCYKGVPEEKITVISNWANTDDFRPVEPEADLGAAEGLSGHFNVMYGGNVGVAQALGVVIDAAAQLQDLPDVQFVVIGDGVERGKLMERAQREGLENVHFLGSRPQSDMSAYFAHADALLIHLMQSPMYEITIPSKTYAYLASGRPILAAASGDVADLISTMGAGVVCPPGDPSALADAVRRFHTLPEDVRDAMASAGYSGFMQNFTREVLVDRYEDLLNNATA